MAHLKNDGLSERATCRLSRVSRRVARYPAKQAQRDAELLEQIEAAVKGCPEFGYRQIAGLLNVSERRVRRLWERHHFACQKPRKFRPKREVSSNPRPQRAECPDHVWSYDLMHDRLSDRSIYKLLNVIDEFTRECLTMCVAHSIKSADVIRVLWEVMQATGRKPEF